MTRPAVATAEITDLRTKSAALSAEWDILVASEQILVRELNDLYDEAAAVSTAWCINADELHYAEFEAEYRADSLATEEAEIDSIVQLCLSGK